MRIAMIGLALLLGAGITGPSLAQEPSSSAIYGVWWNTHQNVKVQTKPCGQLLCGMVVWANAGAMHDAKVAGTDPLVGVELLKDYRRTKAGEWRGQVFVPDMRRTFSSRIEQVGSDQLKISGCILGGLICKYQMWTRI